MLLRLCFPIFALPFAVALREIFFTQTPTYKLEDSHPQWMDFSKKKLAK
jgi:hypothetical protein